MCMPMDAASIVYWGPRWSLITQRLDGPRLDGPIYPRHTETRETTESAAEIRGDTDRVAGAQFMWFGARAPA